MRTDIQIQKDVMEELKWDPRLNASAIGVAVKNGIVTLSGIVDSYSKKLAAEHDVRKISGVRAIAEDIQIGVSPADFKTDTEIAEAILDAYRRHSAVNEEKIRIKVEKGVVTLEGEVEWDYQRCDAKNAIENLSGIRSIENQITVKSKFTPKDVHKIISAALHRSATIDSGKIVVEVNDSAVTLRGKVRSFIEKVDAEMAAWNCPGVIQVDSFLEIEEPEFVIDDDE